jgi:antitoxin (DNA-binding transcriptional repressor) of toxin-antitoxin stability system
MALVDTADLISISEANKLGVSGLVRGAEEGRERVVLRNNKPVAAVVSIARLEQIQKFEEDMLDATLASARMLTTEARRHSLDDVLAQFGYSREQLNDVAE